MKQVFTLLFIFLLAHCTSAEPFYKGKIVFTDGTSTEGLVTLPSKVLDRSIRFKASEDAKPVEYKSEVIQRLIFPTSKGGTVEYDRLNAQISVSKEKTDTLWLRVAQRGYVTLYYADVDYSMITGPTRVQSSTDRYWYCYREGEDKATAISWTGFATSNAAFRQRGPEYFKDDAALAKKIQDKTYKRDDLFKVVQEYNEWKAVNKS